MNALKTIDLRELEHYKKEQLVFRSIEELQEGDTLRVIAEFNPSPLAYLLRTNSEYQVSYEKEGPDEWILNIKRAVHEADNREQLKELLRELKAGTVSQETKAKAKEFFQAVDAKTVGILEQELIREGISHDEIRESLCEIHLEVLRDALVSKKLNVSPPHPVHTFMEEHKIILANLDELSAITQRLKDAADFESMGQDLGRLRTIAHHLVEAESHHRREEEALFPRLEKHDIVEPPNIMRTDHVEFRKRKQALHQLSCNPWQYDFDTFKQRAVELGDYLARELESHIFKEDNILYQIALQVLSEQEWEDVKRECDQIGYCCFSPQNRSNKAPAIIELDLRPVPPFERHEKIFELWDGLKSGEALRIINDHDPKPLHYQFEAEQTGKYNWNYEQRGPKDWIVQITKL